MTTIDSDTVMEDYQALMLEEDTLGVVMLMGMVRRDGEFSIETAMQIDNDAFYSINQEEEEFVDNAVNDESNALEPVKQRTFHNKEKTAEIVKRYMNKKNRN
ncbi:unnamed protein product [Mucor hiemalis]